MQLNSQFIQTAPKAPIEHSIAARWLSSATSALATHNCHPSPRTCHSPIYSLAPGCCFTLLNSSSSQFGMNVWRPVSAAIFLSNLANAGSCPPRWSAFNRISAEEICSGFLTKARPNVDTFVRRVLIIPSRHGHGRVTLQPQLFSHEGGRPRSSNLYR